jgi:tetratricopeptide (TPR) repeat protein
MEKRNRGSRADEAGLELFKQAMGELSRGVWRPDVTALRAALDAAPSATVKARLANLLTHHHFTAGEHEKALASCREWLVHGPNELGAQNGLISILLRLGRIEELIAAASARLDAEPDNFRLRSALANACWRLGQLEQACEHGNNCLEIQDRSVAEVPAAAIDQPVPAFDPRARDRNVIAFSLYGALPKYTETAIANVVAARHLYPEWTCRIYHDESVPEPIIKRLAGEGAQLRTVSGLPAQRFGTFWRFLVADDVGVDRFLLRDTDSIVTLRERYAVEEWIESGRHFHVMRDHFAHTEIVLAGMWGGVRGALSAVGQAMADFCATAAVSRTADQAFLRERMWPIMRQSVLMHDSCYRLGDSRDYPERAKALPQQIAQEPPVTARN